MSMNAREERVLVLIIMIFMLLSLPAHAELKKQCMTNNDERAVVLVSHSEKENIYKYAIVNRYEKAVTMLFIGIGRSEGMRIIPGYKPILFSAPKGWSKRLVFPEETGNMFFSWSVDNLSDIKGVLPNNSLGGFEVKSPDWPFKGKELFYSDGKLVTQPKYEKLPFTLYFSDGNCYWGNVTKK